MVSIICLFIFLYTLHFCSSNCKKENDINRNFGIDLTGYKLYSFGEFNQLDYKITPLTQLFLGIVQTEGEWINEPRLYIKGNKGYFHLLKANGTNVLYTVERAGIFGEL
ncbi:hypothetical protein HFP66_02845 [Bacillus sp. A17A.1]